MKMFCILVDNLVLHIQKITIQESNQSGSIQTT